jgi:hypothetical protein
MGHILANSSRHWLPPRRWVEVKLGPLSLGPGLWPSPGPEHWVTDAGALGLVLTPSEGYMRAYLMGITKRSMGSVGVRRSAS